MFLGTPPFRVMKWRRAEPVLENTTALNITIL
jgi:hypothetical protein